MPCCFGVPSGLFSAGQGVELGLQFGDDALQRVDRGDEGAQRRGDIIGPGEYRSFHHGIAMNHGVTIAVDFKSVRSHVGVRTVADNEERAFRLQCIELAHRCAVFLVGHNAVPCSE